MVCQIKFTEWTRDDRLRQPVFLGIREDKNASEVAREKDGLQADVWSDETGRIYARLPRRPVPMSE